MGPRGVGIKDTYPTFKHLIMEKTINAEQKAKNSEAGFDSSIVNMIKQSREMAAFYNMEIEDVLQIYHIRAMDKLATNIMLLGLGKIAPSVIGLMGQHTPKTKCKLCAVTEEGKPFPPIGEEE